MKHIFDGYNHVLRFDKGEQLAPLLEQFATEQDVQGAWLSGIGAATALTLGFYDLEKQEYHWQDFSGLYEVVSLQGNLALGEDGEQMFHLHGVFSDAKYRTIGGHVKDLTVGGTLELFVHRTYKPLERKLDEAVGLKMLDL